MAVGTSANFFKCTLAQSLAAGGSETTFYLSTIQTLTGETISTADFAIFGKGTITIDPLNSNNLECASFTAVDGTNIALTGGVRGLSALDYTASTTRAKYHPVGTTVIIAFGVHNLSDLVTYVAGQVAGTIGTATNLVTGSTKLSVAAVSAPNPIAVGDNDSRVPTITSNALLTTLYGSIAGTPFPTGRRTPAPGTFFFDGSAVSRATYPLTFAAICPFLTCTISNASPAVVTATGHNLVAGDQVHFSTTGSLPSGLTTATTYYVLAAGLTANAFEVALSPSGTVVNTSTAGSGTHTVYESSFGMGDGTSTFNLPNLCGKSILGVGAASTYSLAFEAGAVGTNTINVPDGVFPVQGQAITMTGTLPTGLATSTTYYVQRVSSTQIKIASTQALANSAAADKTFTTTGMSGVCTIVYTTTARSILGRAYGEETHGLSVGELAGHTHTYNAPVGAAQSGVSAIAAVSSTSNTGAIGGDTQHNIMSPQIQMNWYGIAI